MSRHNRDLSIIRHIADYCWDIREAVWDTVTDDIPQLAAFCAKTLDAEAANADAPQD